MDANVSSNSALSKIKIFLKEYGIPGIIVHFSLYLLTWGGMYIGINYGLITVSNVEKLLRKIGLDKYVDMDKLENKKKATSFALAWILTKFTQPLRIALTIAITPYILKLLRKRSIHTSS